MKKASLLLVPACAIGLAGCGIRGDLERPGPLWGPDERTPAERAWETDQDAPTAEPADEAQPGADENG